jgi:hypothetical protein
MNPTLLIAALLGACCHLQAHDKDAYSLFNATPADQMRGMAPDRPDATESPITVDAGHVQTETTLFGFAKDGSVEGYSFGETNFKLGLTNHTDIQLVVPFFERETGGGSPGDSGIGDLTLRWKWNLWGNDGGDTAFGIMPFVKAPTASHQLGNDKVEGGVILPLSIGLSERLGVTVMAVFGAAYDEVRDDYGADFINTASFGLELSEKLGAFLEFASVASTRAGADWEGYGNTGLTYAATDNIIFDVGVSIGLVHASQDFEAFTGVSLRF